MDRKYEGYTKGSDGWMDGWNEEKTKGKKGKKTKEERNEGGKMEKKEEG